MRQANSRITFSEYVERWRTSRESGWSVETRRRIPQNIRKHPAPEPGSRRIRAITLTDVLSWIGKRLDAGVPKSSAARYFGLLKTIMNAPARTRLEQDQTQFVPRLYLVILPNLFCLVGEGFWWAARDSNPEPTD
jgi:hypothetical protein